MYIFEIGTYSLSAMKNVLKIISIILLISAVAGGLGYLFLKIDNIESRIENIESSGNNKVTENVSVDSAPNRESYVDAKGCSDDCQKEIEDAVLRAVDTITPAVKTVTTSVPASKMAGTTYVPLGTTYTTTSTDWYTVDDSATYIDLVNDYGSSATVSWEASLKVAHGNGQAFARLWDDTNKIAVNGSEITSINNVEYKLLTTGVLPFWRGRNLYKVQIKSLNSFEVSFTGGKIRVAY